MQYLASQARHEGQSIARTGNEPMSLNCSFKGSQSHYDRRERGATITLCSNRTKPNKNMIACIAAALSAASISAAPSSVVQTLRSKDQALLDATAPGDRATWDRTLTADAVYIDENGVIMQRDEFLKELQPLPAGASGNITIIDYAVQLHGDTALVIHRDDERENYHGQQLHAEYLMTETWLRKSGDWKLALVHVYVVAKDPPAIAIPAAALDEYVGRYSAAQDLIYVIRRDGNELVGGREGGTLHALLAESPDVFFIAGQPRTRKIFRRDDAHKIVAFTDRREGEDLLFTRVPR
jgi:ketosteroid isomerase-like protein